MKNSSVASVVLFAVFIGFALGARSVLEIEWDTTITFFTVVSVFVALSLIALSDTFGYVVLETAFGDSFLSLYENFADYFEPQSHIGVLAGGLLAAAEELVFRGVILEVAARYVGIPGAILVSAVLFGAAHYLRGELRFFTLWAVLEGVLLGLVYVLTSLTVVAAVHALHDIGGFFLLSLLRSNSPPSIRKLLEDNVLQTS
ncbi:MAG: CPBP family intramembrane glutamic endopeptidase [Halobacteria archaeon]|nr:CPBP family intramembrane glutamic endopeptidase [Halobacteria archaeon]